MTTRTVSFCELDLMRDWLRFSIESRVIPRSGFGRSGDELAIAPPFFSLGRVATRVVGELIVAAEADFDLEAPEVVDLDDSTPCRPSRAALLEGPDL